MSNTQRVDNQHQVNNGFLMSEFHSDVTISGTYTLRDDDSWIQRMNLLADTTLLLPTLSNENHVMFIVNYSSNPYVLTVKDSTSTKTLVTIPNLGGVLFIPDGVFWQAFWAMNYVTGTFLDSSMGNALVFRRNGQQNIEGIVHSNTQSFCMQFIGSRGRGSLSAPSLPNLNDVFFRLGGRGSGPLGAVAVTGFVDIRASENWVSGSAYGTDFRIHVTPAGTTSFIEGFRLSSLGNFLLRVTSDPSGGGTPVFVTADTTNNPTGMPSNTAGIFAKDVAGTTEMFSIDEAGNVNQTSPHAKDAPAWFYEDIGIDEVHRSENIYSGKIIWRNESRRDRLIQLQLEGKPIPSGSKRVFIYEESYDEYSRRLNLDDAHRPVIQDWNEVHSAYKAIRDLEISIWKSNKALHDKWSKRKNEAIANGISDPEFENDWVLDPEPEPYIVKPKPF